MGDGDDLIIYHQSSSNDSIIQENGSGNLKIAGDNLYLTNAALSKSYLVGTNGGSVQIRHNNISKLETTVGGISVTGTTDTDNFVNAGVSTFVGIITASAVGNVIPFLFNNYSDLPAASSYHGAFAHVHTVAKGFFAHAGNWVEIVSKEADGRVGSGTETYNIKDLNITGITTIADDKKLYLGNDQDLELYYQTTGVAGAYVQTGSASGNLTIRNQDAGQYVYIHGDNVHLRSQTGNEAFLQAQHNGAVSLYYDSSTYGTPKFTTTATGVTIDGTAVAGGLDISGDIDVDGHTNLDNLSVVGVTTTTSNIEIKGNNKYLKLGASDQVCFVTAGGQSFIVNTTGHLTQRSASYTWENVDGTAEYVRIDTSGRVIIGATSTIGNSYSNNFTVSEASGNVGMQFAGNNSTSNYASIYFGDAGHRQKHFIETQLGTNGHFTIGTIGTGPIRFTNSSGEHLRINGSSGNIGIATATPAYRVDIGDGANDPASGYQFRINANGDYIFALQKQSTPSFSIRNNSTSVVHLNTQNSKRLALGVSAGNASGSIEEHVNIIAGGSFIVGSSSYGSAGSFSVAANGSFRQVLASGTAQDTLIGGISGVSNGFQINTDASNNTTYKFPVSYTHLTLPTKRIV